MNWDKLRSQRFSPAGLLGAGLYAGGAVIVAATAPLLPQGLNRTPLYVAATVAVTAALAIALLPWQRWPPTTLAVLPLGAYALFAVTGRASPGALVIYLPLYSLSFLYLGVTQPAVVSAAAVPVAALSLFVGAGADRSSAVTAAIGTPVWLAIGTIVASILERQRRAEAGTAQLLAAAVALGQAPNERDAAELIATLAHRLLDADAVAIAVRTQPGSRTLTICASVGIPATDNDTTIDIHAETDGITSVLANGEPLLVRDTDAARLHPAALREVAARCALYVAIPGEDSHVGVIAAFWRSRRSVAPALLHAASTLAGEAGRTLERVRDAARLTALADTDPVTNVANRRRYTRALDAMEPGDAVVLLDMDHFKTVNDTHGHAAGDETLRAFADSMTSLARDNDCVARYGGEEFAMVLANAAASGALAVVERLRRTWAETAPLTTFSAGIGVHQRGNSPAVTLALADNALYRAKANGRDRTEVAEPISTVR